MLRIIWIGIQNWVYNDFDGPLPQGDEVSNEEHQVLREAFVDQSKIGWNHFLVGRLAKGWRRYYELRTSREDNSGGKAIAFGRTLVESIWSYTIQVWKRHNESVHSKKGSYSKSDEESICDCAQEMYEDLSRIISEEDA